MRGGAVAEDQHQNGGGRSGPPHPPAWLVNLVAGVIVAGWVASFILRAVWPDRALPNAVDALMLMVAGFMFAGTLKGGKPGPRQGGDE
ncbi:membrane protein [Gordonia phage Trine]|uniref:Membrane protein n=1 Tax=Gordonia phage Trine TaxID=2201431 RepID=A0A2Z4Q937_9CAUD|nr:membrane protein [Gordonia phage Trine]AWY06524.1 membrane protein [Gordonia phage Trine]